MAIVTKAYDKFVADIEEAGMTIEQPTAGLYKIEGYGQLPSAQEVEEIKSKMFRDMNRYAGGLSRTVPGGTITVKPAQLEQEEKASVMQDILNYRLGGSNADMLYRDIVGIDPYEMFKRLYPVKIETTPEQKLHNTLTRQPAELSHLMGCRQQRDYGTNNS